MILLATAASIFVVLCLAEWGWRKGWMSSELGRKSVHMSVGTFVACWPFFLSWNQIRLFSVAFLVVVGVSKLLGIFTAIHSVQRPTFGEVFFALVVGLLTFVTHDKAVYLVALLHMSLADGLAAVIGVHFGVRKRKGYKVFGHTKTPIGTATFLLVSITILIVYHFCSGHSTWPELAVVAIGATALENFAVMGLDNLLVPLLVAAVLS